MKEHLQVLTEGTQLYSKDYENILFLFRKHSFNYNAEIIETNMSSYCEIYDLTDIKRSTCFKYPSNPSCIDLFLTSNSNTVSKNLQFLK